ncbi:MAG: ferritin-like domain-containing protein [Alphaproteobacteria bacterium]
MTASPKAGDKAAGSLAAGAVAVLCAADPEEKRRRSDAAAAAWRGGRIEVGRTTTPDRPARPARPELRPPREMPRRRAATTRASRIALLHALAHIELNAVDLAWDIIARFAHEDLPRAFYDDWVGVAAEEARHFGLLSGRLAALGAAYGDLPAHDGLWEAAEATADDLLAQLAVVPLVLEARGLDVTPAMIARLRAAGDDDSAAVLEVIYRDEIGHVAVGRRWFEYLCARRGLRPETTYHALVRARFKGALKPPFNVAARDAAGFDTAYYAPLAR